MMEEKEKKRSFWTTLPGILTGCAAIITAVGALITALVVPGIIRAKPTPVHPTQPPVIVATVPARQPPSNPPPVEGFFIVNVLSGKCIDAKGKPGIENEISLQLWDCEFNDPNTDQRWEFVNGGFLQNVLSGKCMDVTGLPGMNNENPLQLWTVNSQTPTTQISDGKSRPMAS